MPLGERGIETFGQVVGGIVHDVNNLLFIALACATRQLAGEQDSENRERLQAIVDAVNRAGTLNRILLEGRKSEPEGPLTQTALTLAELTHLLRCVVPPGVSFGSKLELDLPEARIEQCELDRIVMNLVRNAFDVVTDGDRVEIATRGARLEPGHDLAVDPGEYVVVSVFDSGPGVAPEHLDRLFVPFFTTKRRGEGVGLGLTSVDWLVRRRAGAVRVISRPKTGGTLFEVFLPAALSSSS